jgi:perosamine synthetase
MPIDAVLPDFRNFRIAFDPRDKARLFESWEEIIATQQWTEGRFTALFEDKWSAWNGLPSAAFSHWSGAALAALEFYKVAGRKVLCPTNTFIGTPLSAIKAGAEVVFGDCRRDDLCLSFEAVVRAAAEHELAAVWLVHIGGHLAFDTLKIAEFCAAKGITLLEDCAHAHGASWNGRRPGTFGDAGVFSFYATKSLTTGEGGMLVSRHAALIEFAKAFRGYGKPHYAVPSLNHRMSEFTAALGAVQVDRMEEMTAWKNEIAKRELDGRFPRRVRLPEGMVSGYYKYIVFEPVEATTSKVYAQPCHELLQSPGAFPNAQWVSKNHWCVPLYYAPGPAA